MNFTVEKLKPGNLTDVIEIGDAFTKEVGHPGGFRFEAFSSQWQPLLSTHVGEIFVIRDGNRIAALLGAAFVGDMFSGELNAIEQYWYVLPEYRGSKMATPLFDAFEQEAKSRGCKIILMVHLEGPFSEPLEALYTKRGFSLLEKTFVKEI